MTNDDQPAGKDDYYVNDVELARRLDVARVTLQIWRTKGEGPPFYKLGRRVVYDWGEVQEWMRRRRRG